LLFSGVLLRVMIAVEDRLVRKILRLDTFSVVNLFAVFYAIVGLFDAMTAVLRDQSSLPCPLGIELPMLHFTMNFAFSRPESQVAALLLVIICAIFFAITGAISGAFVSILYNLTSRFWPGISGKIDIARPAKPDMGF
jgi:hypothetical protein